MEYFGKGIGNMLGAGADGLNTGVSYAAGHTKQSYPKSLWAPDAGANVDKTAPPTGSVLYGE